MDVLFLLTGFSLSAGNQLKKLVTWSPEPSTFGGMGKVRQ